MRSPSPASKRCHVKALQQRFESWLPNYMAREKLTSG